MNSRELRAAIARENVTYRRLAEEIGISEQAFYNKLQGDTEFKGSEIKKIAIILNLSIQEVNAIFFENSVN